MISLKRYVHHKGEPQMTIAYSPAQMSVTNAELHELIRNRKPVSHLSFSEQVRIGQAQVSTPLNLKDCEFLQGFILQEHLAHDVEFDGSRITGDCYFNNVSTTRALSLVELETVRATFHFDKLGIRPVEMADLMISFKDRDSIPELVTDNKVVMAMFNRLRENPTSIVSYQETKEEME